MIAAVLVGLAGAWALRGGSARRSLDAGAAGIAPIAPAAPRASERTSRFDGLSPDEARGKRIYEDGVGRSEHPIVAVLDDRGGQAPAALLRCANCHGEDGHGTSEGGVDSPDITNAALTGPHGGARAAATRRRDRPLYTEILLKRAIGLGLDPAGQPLQSPMPHYQMCLDDMNDLVAYLRRLGGPPVVPGLTPDRLRLGALLPPPGQLASLNRSARAVLQACADRLNRAGSVYRRRIELAFLDLEDDPGRRAGQVERFLHDGEPFALAWCFLSGAEAELGDLLGARGIPVVGAFTAYPRVGTPLDRFLFYLDGGARSELLAAVTDAAAGRSREDPRLAVLVAAESQEIQELAETVESRARHAGFESAERRLLPPGDRPDSLAALARDLHHRLVETLCMIAPPERWLPLLEAARSLSWRPRVLVPGSLATPRIFDVPAEFEDRLVVAFAVRPSPAHGPGEAAFARLAADYRLSGDHPQAQRLAFASVALIEEALKRAGRDVTRETLVTTLEQVHEFATGVLPPLSYGPNRRIGAPGAYLTRMRRASRTFLASSTRLAPEE
jgi:ABC-type branched-subunit amino acid transport system substrate-binding protein